MSDFVATGLKATFNYHAAFDAAAKIHLRLRTLRRKTNGKRLLRL